MKPVDSELSPSPKQHNTPYRKLDLFPSSGGKVEGVKGLWVDSDRNRLCQTLAQSTSPVV